MMLQIQTSVGFNALLNTTHLASQMLTKAV